ncbi:MAG: hypothetical protein AAGG51_01085 [Cyanobacteria bacterium P01_G01_bin.54]
MDQPGSPLPLESSALLLEEEQPLQLPEPVETAGTYQDPLLAAGTADLSPWGEDAPSRLLEPTPGNNPPSGSRLEPITEQLSQLIAPEPEPEATPTAQSQAARVWLENLLAQDALPNRVPPPRSHIPTQPRPRANGSSFLGRGIDSCP